MTKKVTLDYPFEPLPAIARTPSSGDVAVDEHIASINEEVRGKVAPAMAALADDRRAIVTAALAERVNAICASLTKTPQPKGKLSKKSENAYMEREGETQVRVRRLTYFLEPLAAHHDAETEQELLRIWDTHPVAQVVIAVGSALLGKRWNNTYDPKLRATSSALEHMSRRLADKTRGGDADGIRLVAQAAKTMLDSAT
jgi:hypothetical protein